MGLKHEGSFRAPVFVKPGLCFPCVGGGRRFLLLGIFGLLSAGAQPVGCMTQAPLGCIPQLRRSFACVLQTRGIKAQQVTSLTISRSTPVRISQRGVLSSLIFRNTGPWSLQPTQAMSSPASPGGAGTEPQKQAEAIPQTAAGFPENHPVEGAGDVARSNRLEGETSPYLLQHAHNPVDWYPWGEEAFQKAREENRPIFLSVGYSTCHWCHVMERESFESQAVADVLNKHFVAIKVDREERPDVDSVYMNFVVALTGSGGWPMSVFLTPDLQPFWGGTYYAEKQFIGLLTNVAEQWEKDRDGMIRQGGHLTRLLRTRSGEGIPQDDPKALLETKLAAGAVRDAVRSLHNQYDARRGGFGRGMKFPQPSRFNLLFRASRMPGLDVADRAQEMAVHSLEAMARGGINDHISHGFARYSTDPRWHVPHFEKMLYDNAQLAVSYLQAYQVTKDEQHLATAKGILEYVRRDMTDQQGGFYSAEDADSLPGPLALRKREGAFCVWTHPELRDLLDPLWEDCSLSDLFGAVYGVQVGGNVEPSADPHGELRGQNVLYLARTVKQAVRDLQLTCSVTEAEEALKKAREVLFEVRKKRPRPHLDDKVIVAWNGLMISAFARAAQVVGPRSDEGKAYLETATRAAQFIRDQLYDRDKQVLYRSWRAGQRSNVEGFADDHAFLTRGLLDLYEADPRMATGGKWMEWARQLQRELDAGFLAPDGSGYYKTKGTDPNILLRLKDDQDGAEPAPIGVATSNLIRLATFFGEPKLRDHAGSLLGQALLDSSTPTAFPELMASLVTYLMKPLEVVVAGDPEENDTWELLWAATAAFVPNKVVLLREVDGGPTVTAPGEQTAFQKALQDNYGMCSPDNNGRPTAHLCQNSTCSLPMTNHDALKHKLIFHK